MAKTRQHNRSKKHGEYQKKLTLYSATFEEVVDAVLNYRTLKKKAKKPILDSRHAPIRRSQSKD